MEVGTYQIDSAHSKVGFEISHLVISSVDGSFSNFDGTLKIDKDLAKSSITTTIKTDSIDTRNAKRDEHLKSADFFDATKFPQITFTSKKITGKPEALKIEGELTLHGVKKQVTLDGKYTGAVTDAFNQRKVAFEATTTIKRKDFGLNWSKMVEAGPVVGEEVKITLKIQASRMEEKKQAAY
ncbi:MAG: YceI family protein [Bdellovibrionales bacterium]|nr:YceI family protein [Bdellovibrionales bacterium]